MKEEHDENDQLSSSHRLLGHFQFFVSHRCFVYNLVQQKIVFGLNILKIKVLMKIQEVMLVN